MPDLNVPIDDQNSDIRSLFTARKDEFAKVLRLDKGISKADNWTYITEDTVRYLIIPKNSSELSAKIGWKALFAFLALNGVRLKYSDLDYEGKDSPVEVEEFFSGLANRIEQLSSLKSDAVLKINGKTPLSRGRAAVDLLILKKFSLEPGLEKFLPTSINLDGKSFMKYYLGLLTGIKGIESIRNIPDLINNIISSECTKYRSTCKNLVDKYRIPFNIVVDDCIRKKKKEVMINRKKTIKQTPIHYNKVSDTPFILSKEEKLYFEGHEDPWRTTEEIVKEYQEGVSIYDLKTVRERYSKEYRLKQEFTERNSAFKSRRLTAFKDLASVSKSTKEMESWRLSNNSKQEALDNLSILYLESARTKDWAKFKRIISNLNPKFIKGFEPDSTWKALNLELVRKAFGNIPYYTDETDQHTLENIYELIISLSGEMSSIRTECAEPSKRKQRRQARKGEEIDKTINSSDDEMKVD
jgi:hypothetical protein